VLLLKIPPPPPPVAVIVLNTELAPLAVGIASTKTPPAPIVTV
jgi:hypothetical protein